MLLLERRQKVAARYVRGEAQWQIARAFEVDQSTISRDLAAIRKEWLASAVRSMDEVKARELAKIDATEEQAWRAWTRSQEPAEVLRARINGGTSTTEKVSKGQAGDPRFLEVILKCVEKRCQILGVYEAGAGGEALEPVTLVEVPVDAPGGGDAAAERAAEDTA